MLTPKFFGKGRDTICLENGLSIIENPKPSLGHYGTWLGESKELSFQEKLRRAIDAALEQILLILKPFFP